MPVEPKPIFGVDRVQTAPVTSCVASRRTAAVSARMASRLNLAGVDELAVPHDLTIPHLPDVRVVGLHMLSGHSICPFEPPHRHYLPAIADEFVRRQYVRLPFLHCGHEHALKNLLRAAAVDLIVHHGNPLDVVGHQCKSAANACHSKTTLGGWT